MVEVTHRAQASVNDVFAVLADGWLFSGWVVGASHIREVDDAWPAVGARIHHSVGPWPLTIEDTTAVRSVDPPYTLELEARLWPVGAAVVRLELRETGPASCEITMSERAVRGPGRLLPHAAQAVVLVPRNRESLTRLTDLAVGRNPSRAP
ncbi:SRPBCC family protein [Nocardia rhizosphaerihabitans]|uniref:SRPBCC family protein n=1 Tax=Nocardia rhizosphaerihabitans TaxID=1691570 RepID=UPI00366D98DD